MKVECKKCKKVFNVKPAEKKPNGNYCSVNCCREFLFKKGFTPWNKNLKGIHLSPKSEFKKGFETKLHTLVGSLRIRCRKRDGKQRTWIKYKEPNHWMLLAKFNWLESGKKIPNGYVLHHKDRNTLNDEIENLECLSRAEHILEHFDEFNR